MRYWGREALVNYALASASFSEPTCWLFVVGLLPKGFSFIHVHEYDPDLNAILDALYMLDLRPSQLD